MSNGEPKLPGNRERKPKAKPEPIKRSEQLESKYLDAGDLDKVQRMAGYGTPVGDIGIILGYKADTFKEWYRRCDAIRRAFEMGKADFKNTVRALAASKMMNGDGHMIRWWLMSQDKENFSPRSEIQHSGNVDLGLAAVAQQIARMTPEELAQYKQDVEKRSADLADD